MSPQSALASPPAASPKPAAVANRASSGSAGADGFDQYLQADKLNPAAQAKSQKAAGREKEAGSTDSKQRERESTTTAPSQPNDKAVKDVNADEPVSAATSVDVETTTVDNELSAIDLLMSGLLSGGAASEAPPTIQSSKQPTAGPGSLTSSTATAVASLDLSLASLMRLSAAPAAAISTSELESTSASLMPLNAPAAGTLPVATDLPTTLLVPMPAPAPTVSAPAAPVALTHSMPAPDPGQWAEPLADRIVWLAGGVEEAAVGHGVREARIELHPAEWGSMQIRVELGADGRTKVSFNVETAQARAAIESSLPQLRDLLGTQSVHSAAPSFELSGGLSQQQRSAPPVSSSSAADSDEIDDAVPVTRLRSMSGLIDQFA